MTKRIAQAFIALIVFGVLSVSGWAQSSPSTQESVAEAARKAREQKKPPAKAGKVITNDELSSVAASGKQPSVVGQADGKGTAETAQGEAKGAPTGEQAAGEKKPSESDESRWRKQFADLYHKLHQAQAELDVLQREWGKLQSQYYSDPQKALQQQNSRSDVNDHQQKIDSKKKEIAQIQQDIENLQSDLRKSGGDRSWGSAQ
jgi:predicted RNase H-like nuclease (RuvC/YqgF family)